MAKRVLVLDTETTGFSPKWDRILEFAAAEVQPRTGAIAGELYRLINPGRAVPPQVVDVHGITYERVKDEPTFGEIANEVADFLRDATIAVHNASFDVRMLDSELSRAGKPTLADLGVTIVDTVDVAQSIYPLLPKHNLDALCSYLDISLRDRTLHGAAIDIRLLALAFPKMASDYDAWMAMAEEACGSELDGFQQSLLSFYDEVLASGDRSTPEGVDKSLSYLGSVLCGIDRQRKALLDRCASLVGTSNWCCKHFFARWDTSRRMSWKSAQEALIPGVDLTHYQTRSASQTVTPKLVKAIESRLDEICGALASEAVTRSPHCVTRALTVLASAERRLAGEKEALRKELLALCGLGYQPTACGVKSSTRTTTDYEAVCLEHAKDADFSAFEFSSHGLKVRERIATPCEALWG